MHGGAATDVDAHNLQQQQKKKFYGEYQDGSIITVAQIVDSRIVALNHNKVNVWEIAAGKWVKQPTFPKFAVMDDIMRCVTVMKDGRIITGSWNGTVKVWGKSDLDEWTLKNTLDEHTDCVYCVAELPDGRIVSGSRDNTVKVWRVWRELDSGVVYKCESTLDHDNSVMSVAVMPDGRIVSGSLNTVNVWSFNKKINRWERDQELSTITDSGWVYSVAVMPDGRIVSGSQDKMVNVWRETSPHHHYVSKKWWLEESIGGHTDSVYCVAVMPDGRIVSGSKDMTVKIWREGDAWEGDYTLEHINDVMSVAVMPDGRIVSGSEDNTVNVWKFDTNRYRRVVKLI